MAPLDRIETAFSGLRVCESGYVHVPRTKLVQSSRYSTPQGPQGSLFPTAVEEQTG